MPSSDHARTDANVVGTCQQIDKYLTQPGSRPVRYEIISRDGKVSFLTYETATKAAAVAARLWPGQEQDPDRTGKGWDIAVVEADR
jgi:hypothetical protein